MPIALAPNAPKVGLSATALRVDATRKHRSFDCARDVAQDDAITSLIQSRGDMQLPQSLALGVRRGLPQVVQGGPYSESR